MTQFEKNMTIKKDGKQITNNIEQALITIDNDIYQPYCIIGIDEQGMVLIKQGNTIKYLQPVPEPICCIIEELLKQNKKTTKQNNKQTQNKTDKNTTKTEKQ